MKKKILHIDLDDTLCDFLGAATADIINNPGIRYPQSQHHFFYKLRPIDGALEAFDLLKECGKYDLWILTRPSIQNRLCYTEKADWVAEHLGEEQLDKTILTCHKGMVKGDILIDDTLWPEFEGRQLQFGSAEYPNWQAILKDLL